MEKRGGKREGAGRPTPENPKKHTLSLLVTTRVDEALKEYAGTAMSRNDLVNNVLFYYLSQGNNDFVHCPVCGKPVAFIPTVQAEGTVTFQCRCGHEFLKDI